MTAQEIRDAATQERLLVHVNRSWWFAHSVKVASFDDGTWVATVIAGPHNARRAITNIPGEGQRFMVLTQK